MEAGKHAVSLSMDVKLYLGVLMSTNVYCACADGTLLAAGDTGGVVSAWDVPQSCLLSAAQAHEGYVSGCCWSSGSSTNSTTMHTTSSGGSSITPGNGSRQLSVISCGYDGALCILQVRLAAEWPNYGPIVAAGVLAHYGSLIGVIGRNH